MSISKENARRAKVGALDYLRGIHPVGNGAEYKGLIPRIPFTGGSAAESRAAEISIRASMQPALDRADALAKKSNPLAWIYGDPVKVGERRSRVTELDELRGVRVDIDGTVKAVGLGRFLPGTQARVEEIKIRRLLQKSVVDADRLKSLGHPGSRGGGSLGVLGLRNLEEEQKEFDNLRKKK